MGVISFFKAKKKEGIRMDAKACAAKDVLLCSTTNFRASKHAAYILTMENIPFSKHWNRIPLYLRERYHGNSELCEISINRNEYSRARRAISKLEPCFFNRLCINVI